jgi:hypothetical protein
MDSPRPRPFSPKGVGRDIAVDGQLLRRYATPAPLVSDSDSEDELCTPAGTQRFLASLKEDRNSGVRYKLRGGELPVLVSPRPLSRANTRFSAKGFRASTPTVSEQIWEKWQTIKERTNNSVKLREPNLQESLSYLKESSAGETKAGSAPQVFSKATASLVEEAVRRAARKAREALAERRRQKVEQRRLSRGVSADPRRSSRLGPREASEGTNQDSNARAPSSLSIFKLWAAESRPMPSTVPPRPGTSTRPGTPHSIFTPSSHLSDREANALTPPDINNVITSRLMFETLQQAGMVSGSALAVRPQPQHVAHYLPTYPPPISLSR